LHDDKGTFDSKIVNTALGIAAKILFFLEKIEAKSPPLSFL